MTQKLRNFLQTISQEQIATSKGTTEHNKLQYVVVDDVVGDSGDENFCAIIRQRPDLKPYFVASAKTEAPIAGFINGEFVSCRIDRLLINHDSKSIVFIDYKTDKDKSRFIEEYKKQLGKYEILLRDAYPEYNITGYILWIEFNFELEKII